MKYLFLSAVVLAGLFSCKNTKTDSASLSAEVQDTTKVEDVPCACGEEHEDSTFVEGDSVAVKE